MSGHLSCFRERRGDLLIVIWHDRQGACLLTKNLKRGSFVWPSLPDGLVSISQAQMSYLFSSICWRNPQELWRRTSVG
ncbi:IS66 family insertion sequence element accessory protein TnpB [Bradyrhizobium sp. CCBAU 21362]|uniref:IS66 family insertion sequence element accessory protein TnpB n=1 Tax=Bradyrhizobium sp. CCBAU 21362 TaxID=1325082 RepID=UPI0023066A2C|nr:IS66 family insertion sequence element accessory protein TnpB [Bradyrhizobium sp. CCBAU 21362]